MTAAVSVSALRFMWPGGHTPLLEIPHWEVPAGGRVLVLGPSGSGKSTLLSLLAGVRVSPQGQVAVMGRDWAALPAGRRDAWRADHVGYVFQQFNLLPFLSVRENVGLPCHFSRLRAERARKRHGSTDAAAASLLEHLGLSPELFERRADALSIGQQQRVAAARALIGQPELVIADEPTSALDADSREAFLHLLFSECRAAGASLLFVSHDQSLAPLFDRSLSLAELNRAASNPEL